MSLPEVLKQLGYRMIFETANVDEVPRAAVINQEGDIVASGWPNDIWDWLAETRQWVRS